MQNKKFMVVCLMSVLMSFVVFSNPAIAEEVDMDALSAQSIEEYNETGSLFQQITALEQEKVLMQLEKERAQLDLDLDRLAAEKIKLSMEIDTLSGRSEQQQLQFDNERAKLEAEAEKIEKERQNLQNTIVETKTSFGSNARTSVTYDDAADVEDITKLYKLVNVLGAGNQLQATLQDLITGQNKRVVVGKDISGFKVQSISLDEGVVFVKDGVSQTLNIANR